MGRVDLEGFDGEGGASPSLEMVAAKATPCTAEERLTPAWAGASMAGARLKFRSPSSCTLGHSERRLSHRQFGRPHRGI